MPYNPITLEYHPDDKGLELMGKDEEAKVKWWTVELKVRLEHIWEQQILIQDLIVVTMYWQVM